MGTALLLAAVVGSGIMAERLAGGNVALALLGNTLSTGAMLTVLVLVFGPVSGAHFNPAVSLVFAIRRELPLRLFALYVLAQMVGAIIGVMCAHAMFEQPILQVPTRRGRVERNGCRSWWLRSALSGQSWEYRKPDPVPWPARWGSTFPRPIGLRRPRRLQTRLSLSPAR
jgi:glycerol uptake facilitator-like aquaporin